MLASSGANTRATSLGRAIGLEAINEHGLAASSGVDSALAVQTLRLAALAGPA